MFRPFFHSFILSQVFGMYLIISAIILVSRAKFYRGLVQNIDLQNGVMSFISFFGVLLGLFLVLIHNFWMTTPLIVITVICWLILIKSILWLAVPEKMLAMSKWGCSNGFYYVSIVISLLVGVYLMSTGNYLEFVPWHA